MGKSWRTTLAAWLGAIAILAKQGVNLINGEPLDWELIAAALAMVGIGVNARDKKVTSEQEGLK